MAGYNIRPWNREKERKTKLEEAVGRTDGRKAAEEKIGFLIEQLAGRLPCLQGRRPTDSNYYAPLPAARLVHYTIRTRASERGRAARRERERERRAIAFSFLRTAATRPGRQADGPIWARRRRRRY